MSIFAFAVLNAALAASVVAALAAVMIVPLRAGRSAPVTELRHERDRLDLAA
jgi:hypothetical protein